MMDRECRHFIDDDGTTYLEEQDIIVKRWPKVMVVERIRGTGYDECFCDGCYFGKPCEVKR